MTTTYVLMGGRSTRLYHLTVDPTAATHIAPGHLDGDMEPGASPLPSLCGKAIEDAVVSITDVSRVRGAVCKTCTANSTITNQP